MAKAHPATIVASLTVPKRVLLFCLASDHDWVKAGVGWNRPRLHCVLDFGQMGLALQHGHRVRRRWIAPFDVKLATEKSTERDSQIIPNQRQWMPASQGGKSCCP
jgi:hypothetical protein